jgi:hypothetical protein
MKLEGLTNYLGWTTQFLLVLRHNDLIGIVDSTEICSSAFVVDVEGNPTTVYSPEYLLWQKKDQFLLVWINGTLTKRVLTTVYSMNTARQVWQHLSKQFAPNSRSQITTLKRQLQTITQGNQACSNYLAIAKSYAYQLVAIGKNVDDEDLISYVVGGLNSSYQSFIITFNFVTRENPISFEDFQTELLNFDHMLDAHQRIAPSERGQIAFFTQKSKQHYKKQRFHQFGKPPVRQQSQYFPS